MKVKEFAKATLVDFYTIILFQEGQGVFQVDDTVYSYEGPCIFFATPFQKIKIVEKKNSPVMIMQFHGDFYCIEFHKAEVACNGLLFNNAFLSPLVSLTKMELKNILSIWKEINKELGALEVEYSIVIAYLQLLLAKASAIKTKQMKKEDFKLQKEQDMMEFRLLIEENFMREHSPSFYASSLGIPMNTLTKKCTKFFGRSPSRLIHERIIIESKRRLHLTRQSVKEIAYALNFKDEFYFSRFFKKNVSLSPKAFRESVGIARVADLSMPNP
jgi:AraC family transcriptional activator of pobA